MKPLLVLFVVVGFGIFGATAAPPKSEPQADIGSVSGFRYGNTPKELQPYHGSAIYRYLFTEVPQYRGPGRDKPEPATFDDVPIGFIGPLTAEDKPALPPGRLPVAPDESKHVFGESLLNGATLALEEANRGGGYKGKPFRIVRRTDLVQWGQTSNELVQFKENDGVWAALCSVDSNHNHVLARVTLKVEMPIVNAGGSDQTSLEIGIPWTIRVMNDDRVNSYQLLYHIYKERGFKRVSVIRAGDRDARVGVAEFVQGAKRIGHPVLIEKQFRPGDTDFGEQLEAIRQSAPDAILVWANPKEGGLLLKQMRAMGIKQPVFGYDRMSHPLLLKYAGSAAEGLVAISSYNPASADPVWQAFRARYKRRFGSEPDTFAAHGYDAATLVVRAIRSAGLNRYRIRDALFANRKVHGVTGDIVFDTNLADIGLPWLAEVRNGRFRYFRGGWWESAPLTAFTASFR